MAIDTLTKDELKDRVEEAIFAAKPAIYQLGDAIYGDPELGFKEQRTAARVQDYFDGIGLEHLDGLAITGVKGIVDTGRAGPTVAIIGELDSIIVPDHPDANPETGAAHCCGHNCQIAGMAAAATGLLRAGALQQLAGRLVFFAVPAEEYVELSYRDGLRQEGRIGLLGGKSELIRLGEFDDVDIAMMLHSGGADVRSAKFTLGTTGNGFVGKLIRYRGLSAHAAAAPDQGVNALSAALLGMEGIDALRQTFRDEDHIRVHPIITKGGDLVNVIPADVRLETYVRGATMEAVMSASEKVDRALRAAALAIGAQVEITTIPGYLPQENNADLNEIFRANVLRHFEEADLDVAEHMSGSSDVGDLEHLLPMVQPSMNGSSGHFHGADYAIVDREISYLWNGVLMAQTAIDLLWDEAAEARRVIDDFTPPMTKEEYLRYMESVNRVETFGEIVEPPRKAF
ncbi:MAG: amidohydrolase [Candidatus Dormibacteraceae bacterium]